MNIKQFEFNPFSVNTYILYDDTGRGVMIDAGMYSDKEKKETAAWIKNYDLQLKHLLNTHLHCDHLLGNPFMLKEFGIKTKAHEGDRFLLDSVKDQAAMFGLSMSDEEILVDCFLKEEEAVTFGNASLQVIHVPGHSPGSVVFYSEADKCLFAGDVLFRGSIGRTDLPGGNYEELISGIRKKLFILPDDTVVYSGHGPSTTIGREKKYNPFFPPARNT